MSSNTGGNNGCLQYEYGEQEGGELETEIGLLQKENADLREKLKLAENALERFAVVRGINKKRNIVSAGWVAEFAAEALNAIRGEGEK